MKLSIDLYPQTSPGIVGQVLDEEAVLLRPEAGKVSVLNEVASRIWQLADGSRTIGEIAEGIAEEYQVDLAQAQADTIEFVNLLITKGILVVSDRKAG